MKNLSINLIKFYQSYLSFDKGVLTLLAPGGVCRYEIRCSQFTKLKIKKYGVIQGIVLGLKRVWSCK